MCQIVFNVLIVSLAGGICIQVVLGSNSQDVSTHGSSVGLSMHDCIPEVCEHNICKLFGEFHQIYNFGAFGNKENVLDFE